MMDLKSVFNQLFISLPTMEGGKNFPISKEDIFFCSLFIYLCIF